MTEEAKTRVVQGLQMGLDGELSPNVNQAKLERLLPIARSLREYSPLVIITSLEKGRAGSVAFLPTASFTEGGVHIFPSMADLLNSDVKPKGLVIFVRWAVGEKPVANESELASLKLFMDGFRKGGGHKGKRVWFIEEPRKFPLDEPAIAIRKNMLRSLGLAHVEPHHPIIDRQQGLRLIYTTARPAIEPKRQKTSIVEKPYVKAIMRELAESLEGKGYEVVSWEDIKDLLSATKFPPDALSRLKAGFGILVKHHCGICVDLISIQGNITPLARCDDEKCAEKAKEIEKIIRRRNRVVLGRDMPYGFCFEHTPPVTTKVTRYTEEDDGISKSVKVCEQIACPHCGMQGRYREFRCSRKRLVNYENLETEEQRLILARRVRP